MYKIFLYTIGIYIYILLCMLLGTDRFEIQCHRSTDITIKERKKK